MPPLISIVTPSFNQANFLEATLASVLGQDYRPLEYIVIDGGSTDGSVDILRRHADRLGAWVSEPDHGQTDAINKGLRRARGEVLAYLNSDDLYLPGALSRVAAFFDAHPEVDLVYGDCQLIDPAGQPLGWLPAHEFSLRRTIERAEYIPQPAAFWRRALYNQVGPFDDGLHFAMDYDFFIRAGRAGQVAHLPHPVAAFRLHPGSKTVATEERHWRETLAVSERHGLRPWQPWYWLRRARHWGLRALPASVQSRIQRRLDRRQSEFVSPGS
jgi:glycosyltransferase involved in cell wall biosynthesis